MNYHQIGLFVLLLYKKKSIKVNKMGVILNKIKELIVKWKKKEEKIDAIIDTTLSNLQSVAEVLETLQNDVSDAHEVIAGIQKAVDNINTKLEEFNNSINKMKKSFWYGIFFKD